MSQPKRLPLPPFFNAKNAFDYHYHPDNEALLLASSAWREQHKIAPASMDKEKVHLLLIDVQKDFCFEEGSLFVGGRSLDGALQDNARLGSFIHQNLHRISQITCTLDSHLAFQIFFASFWVDEDGKPLKAHREVHLEDMDKGRVRVNPHLAAWLSDGNSDWLEKQVRFYLESLEEAGKYKLYLWPPHCILGSSGHSLVGLIDEARMWHAFVRSSQNKNEIKGLNPLSENYSILKPEVLETFDGQELDKPNEAFLKELRESDKIIVAGQAASHCIKSSMDDLVDAFLEEDPALLSRVYLLTDCMSSVTVPDGNASFLVDFTEATETALARYASLGVHLVKSSDAIEDW